MTVSRWAQTVLIWLCLFGAVIVPLGLAANSPLLAWREPVYIAAGFSGVVGLCLLLFQPLLASGALPGMNRDAVRRAHGFVGAGLFVAVAVHIAGLWVTSPPDVVDALLFRSPTPFAVWGVAAMWAVIATAILALTRRRLGLRWRSWRIAHSLLAAVIVVGTVVHAVLIEGTMEALSKYALCALVAIAALRVLGDPQVIKRLMRRKS